MSISDFIANPLNFKRIVSNGRVYPPDAQLEYLFDSKPKRTKRNNITVMQAYGDNDDGIGLLRYVTRDKILRQDQSEYEPVGPSEPTRYSGYLETLRFYQNRNEIELTLVMDESQRSKPKITCDEPGLYKIASARVKNTRIPEHQVFVVYESLFQSLANGKSNARIRFESMR